MDIGVALPQMAEGLDGARVAAWCCGIDEGPFSSVSAGERITFRNLEGFTLCAAAAAYTERVRVFMNVAVAPWHAPAMLAKQMATIDVISRGRAELAVGVGGRPGDYAALGSSFAHRHQRVDDAVTEVRRLWGQGPAADGAAVGPIPERVGGLPILASAMGPRAMARAAHWADGVSGFSLLGDPHDAVTSRALATTAWAEAGRATPPRIISGVFVVLGPDAEAKLQTFAFEYLSVFGAEGARALAGMMTNHTETRLVQILDGMGEAGCDELILVPGDSDPDHLARLTDVVGSWNH